ncbi:MAG: helix-turn-helix domain-containing protein, partial [Planctomycetales bacterium]
MKFGNRVRQLRQERALTQRQLAALLDVTSTYISKVENTKLHHGDYPSESFIIHLAEALDADTDELLLLADKVPPQIRQRICERPEAFRRFAELD